MRTLPILFLLFFTFSVGFSQENKIQDIREFQRGLNAEFRSPKESPLSDKDRLHFRGLDFFPADTNYVVEAKFVRTPSEAPFAMPTTTDRVPIYVKYGEAYFKLKGKKYKLNLYQSQQLLSDPEYYDYLFLPFTDETNGETTYSGGRYLDLRIPEGDSITIDFNKAYNPYCAYSAEFSCPIPPEENDLQIAIPVGVKKFGEH